MRSLLTLPFLLLLAAGCNLTAGEPNTVEGPDEPIQVETTDKNTPKVTGIGGIFFYAEDPKGTKEWYGENLGLAIDDYGSVFEFRNANDPDQVNYARWSPMNKASDHFAPSQKEFMINYRVQNMDGLVEKLRANGVTILDSVETHSYGKFVHIMDPAGRKIELWEPVDSVLTQMGGRTTR